jgi:hypothetical protein
VENYLGGALAGVYQHNGAQKKKRKSPQILTSLWNAN